MNYLVIKCFAILPLQRIITEPLTELIRQRIYALEDQDINIHVLNKIADICNMLMIWLLLGTITNGLGLLK